MRLAVLGDPVEHSLSPAIHQAAFQAEGIAGSYTARRVDAAGLEQAFDEIRRGDLDGANVTMPHKHLAGELCDVLAPEAARTAAVNTLVRVGSSIVGHNTDVAGVTAAWRWASLPTSGPVLVLGAGGAAAAALVALEQRILTVSARSEVRAAALLDRIGVTGDVVAWGVAIPGAVVVNATPVGMHGEPADAEVVAGASGWFEMAYGSGPTPAVAACRDRGVPVSEGPDMLLAQALESFRLWTGRTGDAATLRAAMMAAASDGPENAKPAHA
jgi:shikimate dehydrogenase